MVTLISFDSLYLRIQPLVSDLIIFGGVFMASFFYPSCFFFNVSLIVPQIGPDYQ